MTEERRNGWRQDPAIKRKRTSKIKKRENETGGAGFTISWQVGGLILVLVGGFIIAVIIISKVS